MCPCVEGTFYGKIAFHFSWIDPKNIGKEKGTDLIKGEEDSKGAAGSWIPTPRFENIEEIQFDDGVGRPPRVKDRSTGETGLTMFVSGKFSLSINLRDFPFDIQFLEVRVRFTTSRDRCRIVPARLTADNKSVFFENSLSLLDWHIHEAEVLFF